MYLQTHASLLAFCARLKTQAVLVSAMLFLGIMIATTPTGAQTTGSVLKGALSGHPAMQEPAGTINYLDSPTPGEVSFIGSAPVAAVNQVESFSALPEAPSAMAQAQALMASMPSVTRVVAPGGGRIAPIDWKHIPAGWVGQPLTARDKMEIGARDLYSPFSMLGYVVTAGYAHAVNGQPNYGTNLGAFGQQFGAIVLRDTTEGIFTDMVFAPVLHEDPRYYVEGPEHNFIHRVLYSITRPILTRTDSGRETINGAELLGYGSASALSYTYYPAINQNFHDTAATFGDSLAGSALGNLVSEFSGQFLEMIHLKKRQ